MKSPKTPGSGEPRDGGSELLSVIYRHGGVV